jgi:elongation factor P
MIDVNDLRKGVTFEMDGSLYRVVDYSFNKPGRGNATIRIKARNIRTGSNIEKTFNSGGQVQDVRLEYRLLQYLYADGDFYFFMDTQTFEQPAIPKGLIEDVAGYLKEGLEVKLTFYEDKPIDVELPTSVDLKIVEAEIAVRGDTATGVNKLVTLETGMKVSVPNFVVAGDTIRVDTRTGQYLTRV